MVTLGMEDETLKTLHDIFKAHHGNCRTLIHMTTHRGEEVTLSLPEQEYLRPSEELQAQVEDLLGKGSITFAV